MRATSGGGGRSKVVRALRRGGWAALAVLAFTVLLRALFARAGGVDPAVPRDVPRVPEGRMATGPAGGEGDGSKVVRRLRQGVPAVLGVLVAAAFLATLFVVYGTVTDNRWYKIVAIQGSSMTPTLKQGDAVVITRPPARLKPGMVAVLQVNGSLVTHRIVAVRRDGSFVTKGDANDVRDDWSGTKVRVAGVVRADIPFLGRVLRTLGSAAWLSDRAVVPAGGSSSADFTPTVVTSDDTTTTDTTTTTTDTTTTETTTTETTDTTTTDGHASP